MTKIRESFAAAPVVDAARALPLDFLLRPRRRLLLPDRVAGSGVEGADEPVCVLREQHAVDHDRCRPQVGVDAKTRKRLRQFFVDRRPSPDDPQVLDVVAGDLIGGRIASESLVAAEVPPFDGPPLRADREGDGRDQDEQRARARQFPMSDHHILLVLLVLPGDVRTDSAGRTGRFVAGRWSASGRTGSRPSPARRCSATSAPWRR